MSADLTKRGTPRKRDPRPGEGQPRKGEEEVRRKVRVSISHRELRERGWDGQEKPSRWIQRQVLALPKVQE